MATWPTAGDFPQVPILQGWSEKTPETGVWTSMETGPEKVRQRFTAASRPFTMQLALTAAQVETLDAFFITTLAGGTLAFDWAHPRTGTPGVYRFAKEGIEYRAETPDLFFATFSVVQLPS